MCLSTAACFAIYHYERPFLFCSTENVQGWTVAEIWFFCLTIAPSPEANLHLRIQICYTYLNQFSLNHV